MLAPLLVILAALYLAIAIVMAARRRADYSHRRHTISELGETGSRDEAVVGYGVFLPVGLVVAAAAVLAGGTWPAAGPAAAIAAGYCVAALFPCDPGSPFDGSWKQGLHNLGGGIQYVGGALSLLALGEDSVLFRVAGFGVFAAVPFVSFPGPFRGAVQRIAEILLFASSAAALYLVSAPN